MARLNIKHEGGDTLRQAQVNVTGGRLLADGCDPDKRANLEHQACVAHDLAFAASRAGDSASSEGWYRVAESIFQVLAYTNTRAFESAAKKATALAVSAGIRNAIGMSLRG